MWVVDDPKTYGRARLSFADEADIDEFASVLGQFERGEIGPDAWRGFRIFGEMPDDIGNAFSESACDHIAEYAATIG